MSEHRMPDPFKSAVVNYYGEVPIEEVLSRLDAVAGVTVPEYVTDALRGKHDESIIEMMDDALNSLARAAHEVRRLWLWIHE